MKRITEDETSRNKIILLKRYMLDMDKWGW